MKKIYALLGSMVLSLTVFAPRLNSQIVINPTATPANMVSNLVGTGVTTSGITYIGNAVSSGTFTATNSNIGLTSGIILSTGQANTDGLAIGCPGFPFQFASTNCFTAGFPELTAIAGSTTFDGVELRFSFVPQSSPITFRFVFASEEYPEFVNTGYNDAFGFLVTGPNPSGGNYNNANFAVIPGTTTPITINTVNAFSNSSYYVVNNGNTCTYDAFTTPITATIPVIPCSTYTIRLMIADGGDQIYDSAVFLEENSFGSAPFTVTATTLNNDSVFYEGCAPATLTFSRPTASPVPLTIQFTVAGTATPGVDYTALPSSVTIPANQTSTTLTINGIEDGIAEPAESIIITFQSGCGAGQIVWLWLRDKPLPTVTATTPPSICSGSGAVSITATGSGGVPPYTYAWNNGAGSGATVSVNPESTTNYTVTLTDFCGSTTTATSTVTVSQTPSPPTLSSNSPICNGGALNLSATAPAGATFNWTGPAGFASTLASPSIATVIMANAGIYSATATVNGCTSAPATLSVSIINSPAAPPVNNNGPICEGAPLNLTTTVPPATGLTYEWTGPNGFTSSSQNPTISSTSALQSGTYSLVISVNGCTSNPGNTSVVINAIPDAPTLSSNSPVCETQTLSLTANIVPGGSFNWTGPNGFTSTQQSPSIANITPSQAGDYTATVTVNGCTSPSASTNVSLIGTGAPVITSNAPLCENQTLTFNTAAPAPTTIYAWTGPNGFMATSQNPSIPNVTSAASGTYTLVTNTNGCISDPGSISITIYSAPAQPSISNSGPVCANNTPINLTTAALAGATYLWSGPMGYTSSLQNPVHPGFATSGSFDFSLVVSVNGCESQPGITTVMVNAIPSAPAIISNAPICENETLEISTNVLPNGTLNWTGPAGFTSSNATNVFPAALPSNSGTYTLTATVNGCTSNPSSYNVVVNAIPAAPQISSNSPVCQGAALQLTAAAVTGGTFNWNGPNGFASGLQSPSLSNMNAAMEGNYTATVSVNNCISPAASLNVAMTALPPANAGADVSVCSNQAVTIGTPGLPDINYSWSPSNFGNANTPVTEVVIPNLGIAPTNIVFTLTANYLGCTSTDQVVVTVNPEPQASFTQPAPQCYQNHVFNFAALGSFTNNANFTWTFSDDASSMLSTDRNPQGITWGSTGLKYVTLSVSDLGCQSTPFTLPLIINPSPLVDFVAVENTGCEPFQAQFNSLVELNSSAGTYLWTFGNGFVSGVPNTAHTYLNAGTYNVSLKVTNLEGCSDQITKEAYITVFPKPTAAFSTSPFEVDIIDPKITITNESQEAITSNYSIYNAQGVLLDEIEAFLTGYIFPEAGTYTIEQEISNAFGCRNTTVRNVNVKRIYSLFIPNSFSPNNDGINDEFRVFGTNVKEYSIAIFNRWGHTVYISYDIESGWDGRTRLNKDVLANGIYTYVIKATDFDGNTHEYKGNVNLIK